MERADDAGLHEETGAHDAGDPPPRAEGHAEEPLFQRKAEPAICSAADDVHGACDGPVIWQYFVDYDLQTRHAIGYSAARRKTLAGSSRASRE
jgi:hypothetical protein